MKFQKLTIHNIASIEDAVIDFETPPLADSEVFLITGKTGAGKSTILDAICLALFADTPRLDGTKMQGDTKDGDKTVKIDDPRQLMRRNTGEAFVSLTFTGSNGVHYESTWSVARARKKATGNMQSKDWQLKNLDTDQILIKDKEIEAEIHAAIGLDFNQFCRTTMLAQGEFTRFLNSKDDEKAEILEKITGVDVYSKIGAKVFEITGQKKQIWDDAKRLIEGTHTLTDAEVEEKRAILSSLDNQYNKIKADSDKEVAKRDWLTKDSELNKAQKDATDALRIANEALERDDFKKDEQIVKDWNATIDARLWLSEVRKASITQEEQAKIIDNLANTYSTLLGGQKHAEKEVSKIETAINDIDALLSDKSKELTNVLIPAFEKAKTDVQDADEVCENDGFDLTSIKDAIAMLNLPELRQKRETAKELLAKIAIAKERIETLASAKSQDEETRKSLAERKKALEEKEKQSAAMAASIHDAKIRMDVRKEDLDKQSDTINKFASTLRTKLQIGDICPVCRQEIKAALPHEDELEALVSDLQKVYGEAEKEHKNLTDAKIKLDAEIKTEADAYERDSKAFTENNSVTNAEQNASVACKACGINNVDNSTPSLLTSLAESTTHIYNELNAQVQEGEARESTIISLADEYNNLTQDRQALVGKLETAKTLLKNVQAVLTLILSKIPSWKDREPLDVVPVVNLLAQAQTLHTSVTTSISQLQTAKANQKENQTNLNVFLATHPELNLERLEMLNVYTHDDILHKNDALTISRDSVVAKKTLLDNAERLIAEHQTRKPEIAEGETFDVLTERIKDIEKQLIEIGEKKGAINQELKTDKENRERLGAMIEDAEKKKEDYQKWSRMNQLIGDATGNKFRKIAQSYVLTSLIHSANSYMKTLTDRYTLKVTPGTFVITLEDAYQGFVSRAASTISGGESFLVSLSLALALSDIGQTLSVDTLFIDEGFGTLSGEPLQNAINTLRSLHTKAGRHVGIISHVEELQERIPVQIQVNQEGNNSNSTIKVIPLVQANDKDCSGKAR